MGESMIDEKYITNLEDLEAATKQIEEAAAKHKQQQASEDAEYKEKFLRLSADFLNHKRRTEQERFSMIQSAYADVIAKFIPVIDDLGRALATVSVEQAGSSEVSVSAENKSFIDGVSLVYKNAQKTLTDLGVTEIVSHGKFDPNYHEALMQVDSAEHQSGDIVTVFVPGYSYRGSVIRHAKVSVAR